MKSPIYRFVIALLLGIPSAANGDWGLSQMITRQNGQTTYNAKPVDEKLINPWPAELEAEFQRRAHEIITAQTRDVKAGVNTYFENEKRTYGYLMAHVLGGNTEVALKHLQARDDQHQEWHRETAGIDYYACFTLKHQMRKYFYFGDLLDPEYRKQMYEGAKKWTEKDPLRRPHYAYQGRLGTGRSQFLGRCSQHRESIFDAGLQRVSHGCRDLARSTHERRVRYELKNCQSPYRHWYHSATDFSILTL